MDLDHGYGKGANSGAMIGYVQNMNLKSILGEVNSSIQTNLDRQFPLLRFYEEDFDEKVMAKTSQKFKRPHVFPSPFDLRHLWIDLR